MNEVTVELHLVPHDCSDKFHVNGFNPLTASLALFV